MKSFEVSSSPIRCAKFVTRKQWIVVGSDDFFIRVFNYNTMEKVRSFEAHSDFIRAFAVHPTLPYLISCSDDFGIKLWDWDKNWESSKFDGHTHFVMGICINPKDLNSFASASLDTSIKVPSLPHPLLDLEYLNARKASVQFVGTYIGSELRELLCERGQAVLGVGVGRLHDKDLGLPDQELFGYA